MNMKKILALAFVLCLFAGLLPGMGQSASADNSMNITLTIASHTHAFSYSASGDTITATCTEGCDITEGLTLTVSAPAAPLIYDGSARAATLSTGYNTTAFPGSYEISYKQGETVLTSAPTNAGTYTASVTVGEATASVTYTIEKASIKPTVSLSGWTYGDAPKTPEVTGNSGSGTVTYAYKVKGAEDSTYASTVPTNAGDYTVKATIDATNNYNGGEATADFTISRASITPTVSINGWTYGQTANTPLVGGNTGGGTETITYAAKGGNDYSATVPTDAGNYTVKYTVAESTNYSGGEATADFTIGKKAASVTAENKSKTYGETDPELTATVSGTVGSDTLNYSLSRAEGENAGEYAISVTPGENPNYTVTTAGAVLTVNRKTITVTAEAKSKTYGEADPELTATVTGAINGDTINYTLSRATGEAVNSYAITVTPGNNPNYELTVQGADFTVTRRPATVTAENKSKTYGDADPTLTATVEGAVNGDTLNYTVQRAEGENAGSYTITVTLGENPNYEVNAVNGSFTVNKKTATVTADPKSKTYGEADPELTATVSGTVGTDTINYTLSRTEGDNVGSYAIIVNLGENPNYEVNGVNAALTVGQATVNVTANAQTKVYGEADPTLTYTVEGLPAGVTLSGSLIRDAGDDVGSYAIKRGDLSAGDNCAINYTGANLTVSKKSVTVTAEAKSKIYGDADPELTYTVEGLVGSDTLSGALSRASGENVGTYAITQGTLNAGGNYTVTFNGANLTIAQASVTVTAENKSKTYGEDDPALTATVTGAVGSDPVNYTLSRAAGDAAGDYAITVTPGENPNYEVSAVNGTFTVNKKSATVTAENKTKTYGEDDPALTAIVTGVLEGDTISYTLNREAGEAAGSYAITVTPGENPNYDVNGVSAALTVGRKAAYVTAEAKSKTYGESDPELTATVSGTVGSDTLNYTLSRAAGNDVGSYVISVTLGENPNYDVTPTNAVLTVNKAPLTVTAAGYTGSYDGNPHGITVDVGSSGATVYYAATELTAENYATAGSTTAPTYTDAGENTVYFYVVSGNYDPDVVSGSKTVIITRATGTATDAQKPTAKTDLVADNTDQALVTTPAALPEGYTKLQYSLDGETWTDTVPTGKDAGSYTVNYKYVGDKNHNDFQGEPFTVTIKTLTVSFEVNGGSAVAAQSVIKNGKLEQPANPTREGYAFDGWFEDATCTVPYDFNKTVTGNVTLYAKWTPNVYQVTGVYGATTDANHIWYKQSGTDTVTNNNTGVEITVKLTNGPDNSFAHFDSVQIDGVTLTLNTDYSVREGSTVVTLFPATLRRLGNGAHTLTVLFDNNSVSTRLTVRQNSSTPATGDESNAALYLTILVLSALGMAALAVENKKRRTAKR